MDAKFTLPEHWEDWVSWGLGIWLCLAPWALYFEQDYKSKVTAVATGVLLIATQAVTLSAFRAWEEWLNVVFGSWLVVAPWLLGISNPAAIANFLIVGIIVASLAGYELRQSGKRH
jgi:SPW repeat-containing protein